MNKVTRADFKIFNDIANICSDGGGAAHVAKGAFSVPAEFALTYKVLNTTFKCFTWDCTSFPADFSFDIAKVCW